VNAVELEGVGAGAGRIAVTRSCKRQQPYLPPTEQLLTQGGDARIAVSETLGSNVYGCMPHPDMDLVSFGSSTASVVSKRGFNAANRLRQRLLGVAGVEPHADSYAREIDRVRRELVELCGLGDFAGLEVIIGASGTDLHLIAALLVSNAARVPTRIIMVDAVETGSRVTTALRGCHFSSKATLGTRVTEGQHIAQGGAIEIVNVAIRLADGAPRPSSQVDDEVESLVADAAARGWRALVVLVDVSKTGMIAPSPACVMDLHQRYGNSLDIFVDACQFRVTPATLRAYLNQGFMVAVTGSKFVTGPTFSGALFIPAPAARRLRGNPLPVGLRNYCARADWPGGWNTVQALDCTANFGLLLRWEAALEELRMFRAIPEQEVAWYLQTFADAIHRRLYLDPAFEAVPVPTIDRAALFTGPSWDQIQTIFPFVLCRPRGRGRRVPLSRNETLRVHALLQGDLSAGRVGLPVEIAAMRCQLGQPVACGERSGVPVSALRLCASARLVVEAASQPNRAAAASVMARAAAALDKTSGLIHAVFT